MPEYDSTVQYRDVPGFPGYKAGSDGTVWSCYIRKRKRGCRGGTVAVMGGSWRKLSSKLGKKRHGRCRVSLCNNGKIIERLLHHIVLEAFVGSRPPGLECRHLDGNPANNSLENLKWGTSKENAEDCVRHGRTMRGEKQHYAKLTVEKVLLIREARGRGEKLSVLAKRFMVSEASISAVALYRTWRHV